MATLACALYWFHPLAWFTLARLKADAERATDEQVVQAGVKASDYCAHLLDMARLAAVGHPDGFSSYGVPMGIPMARIHKLEGRLQALLQTSSPRRGWSKFSTTLLFGSFVLAFVLLASLQLRLRVESLGSADAASQKSTSTTQNVAHGGTVSLLGIAHHPSTGQGWWTPSGTPLPVDYFLTGGSSSAVSPGHKTREFVASFRGIPESASWRWKTEPGTNWASGEARFGSQPPAGTLNQAAGTHLIELSASIPQELSQLTVKVGIANDAWQTQNENPPQSSGSESANGHTVTFARGTEDHGNAAVTVTHTIFDEDVRVVAVDASGHEHTATHSDNTGNDTYYQASYSFAGLSLIHVKTFRLQTRPFHWVTFSHVLLDPSATPGAETQPLHRVSSSADQQTKVPIDDVSTSARVGWQPVWPGIRMRLDTGSGKTTTQNEVPVILYLSLDKGKSLPKTDWNNMQVSASGYSQPIQGSNVSFRGINITGWKPTGRSGEYMALVRKVRLQPAGKWLVSVRLPFPIGVPSPIGKAHFNVYYRTVAFTTVSSIVAVE